MKTLFRKIAICIVALSLIVTGLPTNLVKAEEKESDTSYPIKCELQSEWDGGYVANITLKNNTDETLENWGMKGIVVGSLDGIWNGALGDKGKKPNEIRIHGEAFNQDVEPGQEVTVGIKVSGGSFDELTDFTILKSSKDYLDTGFSVEYKVTSSWDNHANIEGVIRNEREEVIKDWTIVSQFDGTIENIWNAKVAAVSGSSLELDHASHNQNIPKGGSVTFGFTCVYPEGNVGTCPWDTQLVCVDGTVEDVAEQAEWNR